MRRDTANVAFLDILFIMLLMIIPLINQPIKSEGKDLPLSITISWDDGRNVDIDSYLLTPQGEVLWFGNKDLGSAHIDKDDLGTNREQLNREIILVDEPQDGIYYFSLHGYRYNHGEPQDLNCAVLIEDEDGKKLWENYGPCPTQGEEQTLVKFQIVDGKASHFVKSYIPIVRMRKKS